MKIIIIISLILMLFCGNAVAWYDYDYDYRIPVEIDNSGKPVLDYYQFNVSFVSGINSTSIRVVNESSSTIVSHWCENVTNGLCYELWFNTSVGSETNNDYYIYYDNDDVTSTSDYDDTFTKKYNDSGLVLELHMDEGTGNSQTDDTSGEGNHATLTDMNTVGDATSGWQGVDGGQWDNRSDMVFADGDHLQFDGSNDYITCGHDASLNFGTENFTVAFWMKKDVSNSCNDIMGKSTGALSVGACSQTGFTLITMNNANVNDFYFSVADGTTGAAGCLHTGSFPSENTFVTMVINRDSGTITCYRNGEGYTPADISSVTGSLSCTSPLTIGTSEQWPDMFNGAIDEIRVYNRSLSEDEIYRLYIRSKYATDIPVVTTSAYEMPNKQVNISLYSFSPSCIFTNYTGIITGQYIVESNYPLNYTSLAFLYGLNYTPTSDMHSYIKVPANTLADDSIYRAHNRNQSLLWEDNSTITEDNVWKWCGGDNNSFWIAKEVINSTHTWVNMTGNPANVFSAMHYIDRTSMDAAPKTGMEINRAQGIIIKLFNLEEHRGRDSDYYVNMYFDTQLESTPTENINIWYCNDSFGPLTDDPTACQYCARIDTWNYSRWTDHPSYQPHSNVSYANPLTAYADMLFDIIPTKIVYLYFASDTVSSKSYLLNATNYDPSITNITFAETNTMWTYNELTDTSTPLAYTPSIYVTFVRDYEEFLHHLYIANDQDVWGHSDIYNISIGISDISPTHTVFNYYWLNGTTDYYMNGSYSESFWVNMTYGFDPDNGASLTHTLSLYDADYNFIAFVNDSLIGNATDEDVFFDMNEYINKYSVDNYRFKIVSTDNEGSISVVWSKVFTIPRKNWFYQTTNILQGFPTAIGNILSTSISFLPLLVGILISGFLLIISVGIFGKFKRW